MRVVLRTNVMPFLQDSCKNWREWLWERISKVSIPDSRVFDLGRSSQTHACNCKDLSSIPRYCVKKIAGYGGAHLSTSSEEAEVGHSLDLLDSKGSLAWSANFSPTRDPVSKQKQKEKQWLASEIIHPRCSLGFHTHVHTQNEMAPLRSVSFSVYRT